MEFTDVLAGKGCSICVDDGKIEVAKGEIVISSAGPEHLSCVWDGNTFVALDTTLTPELELEGLAREFKRGLQEHRRALGLKVSDRIRVLYASSARIAVAIDKHRAYLMAELMADELVEGSSEQGTRLVIDGEKVEVAVKRA
jgi:isoleucyl-tRNA synthetase